MVKFFAEERFKLKELSLTDTTGYYVSRDNTAKIFLNSMYGVCNTNGLNFNAPSLAAKITKETRDVLNMALVWASGKDVDYWRQKCE